MMAEDEKKHAYRRLRRDSGTTIEPPGDSRRHANIPSGEPFHDYSSPGTGGNPFPIVVGQKVGCTQILLFLIAALLAVIVIVILLAVFVISSHHGTLYTLQERVEVVERLARNVDDASQVMRRALGEQSLDGSNTISGSRDKAKKKGGWTKWLEDRGPDEEALITDNAVRTLVRGVRTVIRIAEQIEQARLMETAAIFGTHADELLSGPEMSHILQAVDTAIQHPQAQSVASQTMDLVAHVESAILPVADALAIEIKQRITELLQGDGGEMTLTAHQLKAMVREMIDVTHKIGTGMRDLVVWYRTGGPADATALLNHLMHTSRELMESPATTSLVKVLEGIDWKVTGNHMAESAHNVAAILRSINDAGAVDSGDRLIRSVAALLEDPGVKKVMQLLPGIAANTTALLSRPNAQRLIEHGSALMARVDTVLDKAEAARTVERTAEFLSTFRLLLGALIDGGMHLEVGQLSNPEDGSLKPQDDLERGQGPHHKPSLMDGIPRIVDYKPERQRHRH